MSIVITVQPEMSLVSTLADADETLSVELTPEITITPAVAAPVTAIVVTLQVES
jgi:hypothetical protein